MSERERGQEVGLRFLIDGKPVTGSWAKVTDFEVTPRTDLKETDFIGEDTTDIDIQHHGFDLSWTMHNLDAQAIEFVDELAKREELHLPPQKVQVQVMYAYRTPGVRKRMVTYFAGHTKVATDGFRGRKEYVETKFEAKYAKRRTLVV